jgi:hypothetical protein
MDNEQHQMHMVMYSHPTIGVAKLLSIIIIITKASDAYEFRDMAY